jgi:hypothetical protein
MGKLTLVRPSDLQESVAALIAGTDGSNRRKQLLASSSPTPLLHGIEEVRHLRKTGGAVLETLFDRITNMQHLNAAVPSTDKALHAPSTVSKQQNKIFAEIQKVQDLSESLDALNGSVRAAISAFQAQGKRKMDTEQRLPESNVESTTHTAVTEETSTVTEANTEKSEETKEQERKKNRRELRNIIGLAQKKKILMTKEFDDIALTREKTISEVEVAIADVLSNFDESVFVRDGVIDKLQSSVRGFDELVHHLLDKISTSEERISLIRSRLSETRKELENAKDTISAQSKLLRITREELEVVKAEMVRLKREMIDERARWEELLAAAKRRESMLQSRLVELSRLYDALNDKMVELNKRAAREEELMKQLREERMKQGALLHWLQQRREQTKKKHAAMAIIRWLRLCLKRRKQSLPMTVRVKAKIPEPTTSISPPAKPTITADKANSMDDYHEYVRAKSVSPPHSPIKITAKLLSNDDSDDATRRYDTTLLSTTHGVITHSQAGLYHVVPTINTETKIILAGQEGKLPYDDTLQRTLDRIHSQQRHRSPNLLPHHHHLPLRSPRLNTKMIETSKLDTKTAEQHNTKGAFKGSWRSKVAERHARIQYSKGSKHDPGEYKYLFAQMETQLVKHKTEVWRAVSSAQQEQGRLRAENDMLKQSISTLMQQRTIAPKNPHKPSARPSQRSIVQKQCKPQSQHRILNAQTFPNERRDNVKK